MYHNSLSIDDSTIGSVNDDHSLATYDELTEALHDHDEEDTTSVVEDSSIVETPAQKPKSSKIPKAILDDIREYVDLCEKIENSNAALRIIRERKKELEKGFMLYMKTQNIADFALKSGTITFTEDTQVKKVSPDALKKALAAKLNDPTLVDDVLNTVNADHPPKTVGKIKYTQPKKAKGKR